MRPAFFILVLLALAPFLASGDARAQAPGIQPLDRLLPQIRRSHPGQFYDADGPTPGADGSPHYHLKWMTPDGRILWLDADARTGRVLGQSPGRDSFDRTAPPRADDSQLLERRESLRNRFGRDRDGPGDNGPPPPRFGNRDDGQPGGMPMRERFRGGFNRPDGGGFNRPGGGFNRPGGGGTPFGRFGRGRGRDGGNSD